MTLEETCEEIQRLTLIDLKYKTIFQLFAKMMEEVGEFAAELQIEEAVFGNTHKQIDEGSVGESIDMIIMALTLYYARNPTSNLEELVENLNKKLYKWKKNHS